MEGATIVFLIFFLRGDFAERIYKGDQTTGIYWFVFVDAKGLVLDSPSTSITECIVSDRM